MSQYNDGHRTMYILYYIVYKRNLKKKCHIKMFHISYIRYTVYKITAEYIFDFIRFIFVGIIIGGPLRVLWTRFNSSLNSICIQIKVVRSWDNIIS